MANLRKKTLVNALSQRLKNAKSVIVFNPIGLTVKKSTEFRREARKLGLEIVVTKNTLARIALKDTCYEKLNPLLKGPTAIIYSKEDSIAPSKVIVDFSKQNDTQILGGVIDQEFIDVESIRQIAELPSLNELRSKIIGVINAPARRIVGVIKAPMEQLARIFDAYSAKE